MTRKHSLGCAALSVLNIVKMLPTLQSRSSIEFSGLTRSSTDHLQHEAADLILDWWESSDFSSSPSFPEHTAEPAVEILERKPATTAEWGGTHRRDGIVMVQGKPFNKGIEIHGARLIDMAPTILYLMGQPVPKDMDGRVLEDLFAPAFIEQNPIRTGGSADSEGRQEAQYSAEEAAIFEERLKALGYIE